MKKSFLAVIAAVAAAPLNAESVCFAFQATVTGIRPNASEILGIPGLSLLSAVSGSFSYDPLAAPGAMNGSVLHFELLSLDLEIAGVEGAQDSERAPFILIGDSPPGAGEDVVAVGGSVLFRGETVIFGLSLRDDTGMALNDPGLPLALDLTRFTAAVFEARTMPGDSKSFLLEAPLLSLAPCAPSGASFVRGDTDGDGTLTITDPIRTLIGLFQDGAGIRCRKAADANDDGDLNLTDGIHTLRFLFQNGEALPPPGLCGSDPTPDALDCASSGCGQ